MGFFGWLFGGRDPDPFESSESWRNSWQRDQIERGGTRASTTLQNENQAGIQNRYDAVTERGRMANPQEEDRRSGGDRRQ